MKECWYEKPAARLTAFRIKKTLADLNSSNLNDVLNKHSGSCSSGFDEVSAWWCECWMKVIYVNYKQDYETF